MDKINLFKNIQNDLLTTFTNALENEEELNVHEIYFKIKFKLNNLIKMNKQDLTLQNIEELNKILYDLITYSSILLVEYNDLF